MVIAAAGSFAPVFIKTPFHCFSQSRTAANNERTKPLDFRDSVFFMISNCGKYGEKKTDLFLQSPVRGSGLVSN